MRLQSGRFWPTLCCQLRGGRNHLQEGEIKVQVGGLDRPSCCKEQYCIGTWNARSMSQGKLEVIKQEMARMSINILGISELKWTGMG